MKKLLIVLFGLSLVFTFNSVSHAVTMDFSDRVTGINSGLANPYTHSFDLNNDTLFLGDINDGDKIETAFLYLIFGNTTTKQVDLNLDSGAFTSSFAIGSTQISIDVLTLVSDHNLYASIVRHSSDPQATIDLDEIRVGGTYTDLTPGTPVPEPISMLLFGTGLVGVGGYIRKKFKNK